MVLLFIKEKIVIVSLVFNKGAQVTFTAGFKGAVSRNSTVLGYYKMPFKVRET